jgi:hypothetical protein
MTNRIFTKDEIAAVEEYQRDCDSIRASAEEYAEEIAA